MCFMCAFVTVTYKIEIQLTRRDVIYNFDPELADKSNRLIQMHDLKLMYVHAL